MELSASPPERHTKSATHDVVTGMLFVGLLFWYAAAGHKIRNWR
jgi:hypothetical protein